MLNKILAGLLAAGVTYGCASVGDIPDADTHTRIMKLYAIGVETISHYDDLTAVGSLDSDLPPAMNVTKIGQIEGPLPGVPREGILDVSVTVIDRLPYAQVKPFPGYEDYIMFSVTGADGEDLAFILDNHLDMVPGEVQLFGKEVPFDKTARELYYAIIDGVQFSPQEMPRDTDPTITS